MEKRLPLDAPTGADALFGTAAQFGTTAVGGFIGAASSTNGNSPTQMFLVGIWATGEPIMVQSAYDYLAFNNPSWIPNDRALSPIPLANRTDLFLNIYQEARTPGGIRNFEIGANTSMAHGNAPLIGRVPSSAAKPFPLFPRFGQVIEHPLDEGLDSSEDDVRGQAGAAERKATEIALSQMDQAVLKVAREAKTDRVIALASNEATLAHDASAPVELDEAAVDQMMAEADDMREPVPLAAHEQGFDTVSLEARGEGAGMQAMAASLALGATLNMRRPASGTSLTELVVRAAKKPWPPQKGQPRQESPATVNRRLPPGHRRGEP